MRRRGKATASATALAAGALTIATACGSSPTADPTSPTPLTSSPTTNATSASATPTASSTLDPNSDAAILAAVRAYAAAYQAVGRSGTLEPFFAVSTPDCNCRAGLASFVDQLSAKKAHTDVSVTASDITIEGRSPGRVRVQFSLDTSSYHVLDGQGTILLTANAAHQSTSLNMQLVGATWLVYLSS